MVLLLLGCAFEGLRKPHLHRVAYTTTALGVDFTTNCLLPTSTNSVSRAAGVH